MGARAAWVGARCFLLLLQWLSEQKSLSDKACSQHQSTIVLNAWAELLNRPTAGARPPRQLETRSPCEWRDIGWDRNDVFWCADSEVKDLGCKARSRVFASPFSLCTLGRSFSFPPQVKQIKCLARQYPKTFRHWQANTWRSWPEQFVCGQAQSLASAGHGLRLSQGHAATVRSDGRWMFYKAMIQAPTAESETWATFEL